MAAARILLRMDPPLDLVAVSVLRVSTSDGWRPRSVVTECSRGCLAAGTDDVTGSQAAWSAEAGGEPDAHGARAPVGPAEVGSQLHVDRARRVERLRRVRGAVPPQRGRLALLRPPPGGGGGAL